MNGPPHYSNTDTLPPPYHNANTSLQRSPILNALPPSSHQHTAAPPMNRNIHILPLADVNTNTLPPVENANVRAPSISTSLPSFSSITKLQRLRQWLLKAPSNKAQPQQELDMLIERLGLVGPFNQHQLEEMKLHGIQQMLSALCLLKPEIYMYAITTNMSTNKR